MALTPQQLEEQKKQAEELLFSGPQTLGFAKGLFFGHFNAPLVFPYPEIKPEEREAVEKTVAELRPATSLTVPHSAGCSQSEKNLTIKNRQATVAASWGAVQVKIVAAARSFPAIPTAPRAHRRQPAH